MMNSQDLIKFETEIVDLFNVGKIRAPIHLSNGSEDALVSIFQDVKPSDWCFSSHRSHYHALLKGIDREVLKREIIAGHSMNINSREHKFFSSSIVAGCCPIAVGVAKALKDQHSQDHVWCFVGDMAARTGIFYESVRYAEGFDLPITFVCEDNNLCVNTPTDEVWGAMPKCNKIRYYQYEREMPHSGTGVWLKF